MHDAYLASPARSVQLVHDFCLSGQGDLQGAILAQGNTWVVTDTIVGSTGDGGNERPYEVEEPIFRVVSIRFAVLLSRLLMGRLATPVFSGRPLSF